MSRSYKHNPTTKDNGRSKKKDRTFANRKLRRTSFDEVANGGHYKKFTCQYDICDNRDTCTLNEWLEYWGKHCDDVNTGSGWETWYYNRYGNTIQDAILRWKKYYFFK